MQRRRHFKMCFSKKNTKNNQSIFQDDHRLIQQKYHNTIMEYFVNSKITGNKLKSMGEKQFEISLGNFLDKNVSDVQLSNLYNNLLRKVNHISEEKANDDERE
eukprot:514316_1